NAVGKYFGTRHLLLHNPLALIGRQAVNSIRLLRLQLDQILRHLAKADLLIDDVNKQQGNDRNDQERRPPTGAPPQVGEGLAGREKSVDEALPFRQRRGLLGRHNCSGHDRLLELTHCSRVLAVSTTIWLAGTTSSHTNPKSQRGHLRRR